MILSLFSRGTFFRCCHPIHQIPNSMRDKTHITRCLVMQNDDCPFIQFRIWLLVVGDHPAVYLLSISIPIRIAHFNEFGLRQVSNMPPIGQTETASETKPVAGVRVTTPTAPRGWTREWLGPLISTRETTWVPAKMLSDGCDIGCTGDMPQPRWGWEEKTNRITQGSSVRHLATAGLEGTIPLGLGKAY